MSDVTLELHDVRKNREALVRHFYQLPTRGRTEESLYCAKGQAVFVVSGQHHFIGRGTDIPMDVQQAFDMNGDQYWEMEQRFEGESYYQKHNFQQIACWLQTLPGWPRVL